MLFYNFTLFSYWSIVYIFTFRIQERPPMLSGKCLCPRPKDTWRMFLPTNKLFHSHDSVVGLAALLRQRIAIRMDKDVGLLSQQILFLTYSRMLRVMPKYAFLFVNNLIHIIIISRENMPFSCTISSQPPKLSKSSLNQDVTLTCLTLWSYILFSYLGSRP